MLWSSWRRACRGSPEMVVGVEEEEQKGKDAGCWADGGLMAIPSLTVSVRKWVNGDAVS